MSDKNFWAGQFHQTHFLYIVAKSGRFWFIIKEVMAILVINFVKLYVILFLMCKISKEQQWSWECTWKQGLFHKWKWTRKLQALFSQMKMNEKITRIVFSNQNECGIMCARAHVWQLSNPRIIPAWGVGNFFSRIVIIL